MARFFVRRENIQGTKAVLNGQELEHLRRVLRLTAGDAVTLFDDTGWEHEAVIRSLHSDRGELDIRRSYEAGRESPLALTLALGLTKGEKMDFVVEKATELGVATILPFTSSFTVPKLNDKKIANRTERWRKIALSAAKQCGRTQVPEILPLCEFGQMVQAQIRASSSYCSGRKRQRNRCARCTAPRPMRWRFSSSSVPRAA